MAAQQGWTLVPAKSTPAGFQGDAVLGNGRILLVVRKQAPAAEVYALGPNGPAARLRLGLQASEGNAAARLEHVAVVENTRTASCLEVTYRTAQGAALVARLRVKKGEVSVQAEPGNGAERLRVESPARYAVLPDFFAEEETYRRRVEVGRRRGVPQPSELCPPYKHGASGR